MTLVGVGANPMNLRGSIVSQAISAYSAGVAPSDSAAAIPDAVGYSGPLAGLSFLGQPFAFYLGAILLMFLLKFLSEHEATNLNPEHVHIGGYNLAAVTVTAMVGIAGSKLLFNRYPVPGLTDFVNFI